MIISLNSRLKLRIPLASTSAPRSFGAPSSNAWEPQSTLLAAPVLRDGVASQMIANHLRELIYQIAVSANLALRKEERAHLPGINKPADVLISPG